MATLEWPVAEGLLPTVETEEERARLAEALDAAVATLWALTGRRYAVRRVVARPCPRVQDTYDTYSTGAGVLTTPVLVGGRWRNVACNGGSCQSDGPGSVLLPGPVVRVEEVTVGSDVIDSSSYSLEGDRLRRTNGGEWPSQDLARPLGEEGTWSVTYLRGEDPPPGASSSVAALASEYYNAVARPEACRLPKNWQSVSRQGVQIQRISPRDLAEMGMTGLPEVDLWVRSVNPHGLAAARASVASVDSIGGK